MPQVIKEFTEIKTSLVHDLPFMLAIGSIIVHFIFSLTFQAYQVTKVKVNKAEYTARQSRMVGKGQ